MSWAQILKNKRQNVVHEPVFRPNISHIATPDDNFDHKYSYHMILLEEKFKEQLAFTGQDFHLLNKLRPGDLLELAKCTSSEFNSMRRSYKRDVRFTHTDHGI